MFLEIPYMAEKEFDHRRRMISKQFHYQLRNSEKQAFVGPPDNMREHVLAAAKALKVGDWKKCIDYLINPKMNQKVWNLFAETEKVKDMLRPGSHFYTTRSRHVTHAPRRPTWL